MSNTQLDKHNLTGTYYISKPHEHSLVVDPGAVVVAAVDVVPGGVVVTVKT